VRNRAKKKNAFNGSLVKKNADVAKGSRSRRPSEKNKGTEKERIQMYGPLRPNPLDNFKNPPAGTKKTRAFALDNRGSPVWGLCAVESDISNDSGELKLRHGRWKPAKAIGSAATAMAK